MPESVVIEAHKTAIKRHQLSRPLKSALNQGVLKEDFCVFDYGCGRGDDVSILEAMEYDCTGWDPVHNPDVPKSTADLVNLGYVINVIENPSQRIQVLHDAYSLCEKVLVVSAMIDTNSNIGSGAREYKDGYLTTRNTFQKFYAQSELREYLNTVLEAEAFPAAPGIFYIFKDEYLKEEFLQNRILRHVHTPTLKPLTLAERYSEDKELLEDFLSSVYQLGRMPKVEEYKRADEMKSKIGSLRKAYSIIQAVFPDHEIDFYRQRRHDDLLVYLSLANFRKMPQFSNMPNTLRNDIKMFFGSFKSAKESGKELLFKAGDLEEITKACRSSNIGKLLPDDLYIHTEYIDQLAPILRVYVGCGNAFVGEIEEANIIKIHMKSGKISYLQYNNFDKDPHPCLMGSTTVMLRELRMKHMDFSTRENPPLLHRKETFVGVDYKHYNLFKALTEAEEQAGLLNKATGIGNLKNWATRLIENGYGIKGHKLVKL